MAEKLKSADHQVITYYDSGAAWAAGVPQAVYNLGAAPAWIGGQLSIHIQNQSAGAIYLGTDPTIFFGHYVGANTGITYDISEAWTGAIYVTLAPAVVGTNIIVCVTQVAAIG